MMFDSYKVRLHSHTQLLLSKCSPREVTDFLYTLRTRGTGEVQIPEDIADACLKEFRWRSSIRNSRVNTFSGRCAPEKCSFGTLIGFSLFREYYRNTEVFSRETHVYSDTLYDSISRYGEILDITPNMVIPRKTTREWYRSLIPAPRDLSERDYDYCIRGLKRVVYALKQRGPKLKGLSDSVRDRTIQRISDDINTTMRDIVGSEWRNMNALTDVRRNLPRCAAVLHMAVCIKHGLISHSDMFAIFPVYFRIINDELGLVDLSDYSVLQDLDVITHLSPITPIPVEVE